jgi:hypothetical protein
LGDPDVTGGDFPDALPGSLGQAVKERLPPRGVLVACSDEVDEGVSNFHGEDLGDESIARKRISKTVGGNAKISQHTKELLRTIS